MQLLNSIFFKKNLDLKHKIFVDVHSHLLPGIDDGVKTTYESVKIIKKYEQLGYKKLITTPHIMWNRYKNTPEIILEKLEYLKEAINDYNIDITLEAASEYFIDEYFIRLLYENKRLLTFGKNYILLEMSYLKAPKHLYEIILDVKSAGYKPVLAHPERYTFMHNNFQIYNELKELEVLFQLNINSFAGQYSNKIKKTAKEIAKRGMVDFLGSDVHKYNQITTLEYVLTSSLLDDVFKKNKILNNSLLK